MNRLIALLPLKVFGYKEKNRAEEGMSVLLLCFVLAPLMFATLLHFLPDQARPLHPKTKYPSILKRGHIANNANI